MKTRRDFLKQSGMAAAALAATSALSPAELFAGAFQQPVEIPPDDVIRALMMDAIGAAKSAGASYSDVRIGRYRNSFVITASNRSSRRLTPIPSEQGYARWWTGRGDLVRPRP